MKFGPVAQHEELENVSNISIGAVILSRYSSSRLPGKALLEIKNKPILQYILDRMKLVIDPMNIVIATSDELSDDAIYDYAIKTQTSCFRGSLNNVAERFYLAASEKGWDYAIRINGDNVLIDTDILRKMVHIAKSNLYNFISNVKDRSFPKGMSIEIVRMNYYQENWKNIQAKQEFKEHVTSLFYQNGQNDDYFHLFNKKFPQLAGLQLALDTPKDFLRIKNIINEFERDHTQYNLQEIFDICKKLKIIHEN